MGEYIMNPPLSTLPEEFDIIVCGGGSCGCVVAGRLANLDHNLKVLLIEAGESNLNNPWVFRPGIYPRNMKLDSKTASFYESRPSKWLAGRRAVVPCAHILGGGSSINFMMYTRASASDYDDFQAKGWTTKELLPLMKKHETYQRPSHNQNIHGYEGPIKVSFGNYTYPIKDDFLRAVETQGIPIVDDLQDLVTGHGAEHWLKWINRDTGRRSDSAHGYIHSTRAVYSNLYLSCNTKIDKVIIENGRAVGVKTVPTKPAGGSPKNRIFRARKQIIVSGGTLSSPLILQRSGIGDPQKLRAVGVEPIVDLPGVGLNFQDHYLTFSTYRAKPGTESFDDFVRGDPDVQRRVYEEWNLKGTGPLATNGIEAGVKIRPTEEELKDFERWPTPHFTDGWKSYFEKKPDKPVMHYSVISGWFGDHMLMPPGNFFTMFHFLEYPFSRGSTHIKSPDPYAAPDFDTGFMNDERDMVPMVWGYIKSRETARRMDAYAGEVEAMHPFFDNDSPARARDMDLATTNAYALPGNLSANIGHGSWSMPLAPAEKQPELHLLNSSRKEVRQELQYSTRDIQAVEEWVKRHVESTWHSLGTCSMAPKEGNSIVKHGVLDERLNVHGVKGLKVADLSICPDNVGCNTYSTALLIGEKCAVLTGEDLGYTGSALDMKVPEYNAPGEMKLPLRL
ncbi:Alternative oxidase, mitochondrial precursor [Gnomoniopsis smithogilvyi]|uniref:Alternative oxidase, mitochondrial n=1 Tax=Gnomoniopsis smithogilvyi TaxID=1191159 RepID=A0A9W8YM50_9PEZI|nr:Alternative oxidase, mitochondrial precursor [Gnomoniopsis smithogilvyi]